MSDLSFDVGLAYKLKKALAGSGWSESDINLLAESEDLAEIRQYLLGRGVFSPTGHVIDCDGPPLPIVNYEVEEHQKGGWWKWGPEHIKLWLASGQEGRSYVQEGNVSSNKIRRDVERKNPLNACVLDYLLLHPHLIPEEWKELNVFFWGTIYRRYDNSLAVRCLYWQRGKWESGMLSITAERCRGSSSPAVICTG